MCTCFVGAELRPVCSPWGALKSPAGAGVGVEGLVLTSPDLSPGRNRAKPSCEVVVAAEVMAVNTFCTVTYSVLDPGALWEVFSRSVPLAFQEGVGGALWSLIGENAEV